MQRWGSDAIEGRLVSADRGVAYASAFALGLEGVAGARQTNCPWKPADSFSWWRNGYGYFGVVLRSVYNRIACSRTLFSVLTRWLLDGFCRSSALLFRQREKQAVRRDSRGINLDCVVNVCSYTSLVESTQAC